MTPFISFHCGFSCEVRISSYNDFKIKENFYFNPDHLCTYCYYIYKVWYILILLGVVSLKFHSSFSVQSIPIKELFYLLNEMQQDIPIKSNLFMILFLDQDLHQLVYALELKLTIFVGVMLKYHNKQYIIISGSIMRHQSSYMTTLSTWDNIFPDFKASPTLVKFQPKTAKS